MPCTFNEGRLDKQQEKGITCNGNANENGKKLAVDVGTNQSTWEDKYGTWE